MLMEKRRKIVILTGLAAVGVAVLFLFEGDIWEKSDIKKEKAVEQAEVKGQDQTAQEAPTQAPLPQNINLQVPFTTQAPFANWDHAHEEACEEAAILMVNRFLKSKPITGPQDAENEILDLQKFQRQYFGFFESTTAQETATLIKKYYGYTNVEVKYDPTIQDIKEAVASGYPVILPAAGRKLGNPNFKSPGPLYHMLVVRGYRESTFITNDPGTRKGKEYVYSFDALYGAIGDWNAGNPSQGRKVMIVVKK